MRNNDTRARILNSARELFHGRSYSDVGVKEICERARVLKGSFYHFFPSKRDVAAAVVDDVARDWANGIVAEAFDTQLSPLERFDYLVDGVYYWQKSAQSKDQSGRMPGCLFGNLALEVGTRDEVLQTKLGHVFAFAERRFMDALDEGVESGALQPMDTRLTAAAMLAYIEGVILLAKSRNRAEIVLELGPSIKSIRVEAAG